MIVAGTKKEEYREIKAYWAKRLTTNCECSYDVANEFYFPCIIQKSREQLNNCNHSAFVVHV